MTCAGPPAVTPPGMLDMPDPASPAKLDKPAATATKPIDSATAQEAIDAQAVEKPRDPEAEANQCRDIAKWLKGFPSIQAAVDVRSFDPAQLKADTQAIERCLQMNGSKLPPFDQDELLSLLAYYFRASKVLEPRQLSVKNLPPELQNAAEFKDPLSFFNGTDYEDLVAVANGSKPAPTDRPDWMDTLGSALDELEALPESTLRNNLIELLKRNLDKFMEIHRTVFLTVVAEINIALKNGADPRELAIARGLTTKLGQASHGVTSRLTRQWATDQTALMFTPATTVPPKEIPALRRYLQTVENLHAALMPAAGIE